MKEQLSKDGFKKYRKRPLTVQAKRMKEAFEVETLEGTMKGKPGDYLIVGIKGERYPCDKEVFEASYYRDKLVARMQGEESER